MKFFKEIAGFQGIFEDDFLKFSRFGGGGSASRTPTNADDHIFQTYWHNFRERFYKIL